MKKLNVTKEQIKAYLYRQHVLFQQQTSSTFPIAIYRMNVNNEMKDVVIPSICVNYTPIRHRTSFTNRDDIRYKIHHTHIPFPLAHIYKGSGLICYGSLPVPHELSRYHILQPLELLLLNNDRYTSHGGASIYLKQHQVDQIHKLLPETITSKSLIQPAVNLAKQDELWQVSAEVLETYGKEQAIAIMSEVFDIIFPPLNE